MAIKSRPAPVTTGRAVQVAPKSVVAKETKATAVTPKGEVSKAIEVREFEGPVANLGISRSFTVKRDDDYVKVGIDVHMPCTIAELNDGSAAKAIQALIKEFITAEAEEAMKQYGELTGNTSEDEDAEEETETEEAAAETEEEEALTAEAIQAMTRAELTTTIKEYGLDVDVNSFPKTKAGTEAIKEAIISTYLSDDEEEAEEADEEAEEETEEESDEEVEEAELTEDDVRAMKRPELIALIQENDLEVDPAKHPKLDSLKDAVITALAAAGEDEEESEDDEAAAKKKKGRKPFRMN